LTYLILTPAGIKYYKVESQQNTAKESITIEKQIGVSEGPLLLGRCYGLNVELHNLYSSPDIIRQIKSRRIRWAGHVARVGEGRKVYRVMVGKPEGNRPLGRPRRRWEDRVKMDIREIGWGGVEWIHLAQDMDRWRAVVNAVMKLRVVAPRS
jgi:hypothetical protein